MTERKPPLEHAKRQRGSGNQAMPVRLLSYFTPTRTHRRWPLVIVVILALGIPTLVWLLFVLQGLPYRPPEDMGFLLAGDTRAAIGAAMVGLGIVWIMATLQLLVRLLNPNRRLD